MKHQDRRLRIIGGNWRGRKVSFPAVPGLRPTADRVRETLFNWLMHDISGATCLEPFAGSGSLSLEALSRGAASVTLVDQNAEAVRGLQASLQQLGADPAQYRIYRENALAWLAGCDQRFDIIFLDPPFTGDLLSQAISVIAARDLAAAWIYIESAKEPEAIAMPASWTLHRQKRAGGVYYGLCRTP